MSEIKNIQCTICGEYIPKDSEECEYCGEVIAKSDKDETKKLDNTQNISNDDSQNDKYQSNAPSAIIFYSFLIALFIFSTIGIVFYLHKVHSTIDVSFNTEPKQAFSAAIPDFFNKDNAAASKEKSQNDSQINQAISLLKQKKYEASAEILQSEINSSNSAKAYFYMGEIYNEQYYTKIAISYYKKAIQYNSNYFEPKKRLTQIYLGMSDYDSAYDYGTQAMNLNSKDKELLNCMISIYYYNDDTAKLIETYKKLVSVDTYNYSANSYLAYHYYDNGEYKEAALYFRNLMKDNYSSYIAYKLADCYMETEYYSDAIKVYETIMEKSPYEYYYASYKKERAQQLKNLYIMNHKKQVPAKKPLEERAKNALF